MMNLRMIGRTILMKVLKKFIKFIKKTFRVIASFIDKFIITPITKFGLFLGEKTDKGAGKLEKWLKFRYNYYRKEKEKKLFSG